jgi:DNA ligase-1
VLDFARAADSIAATGSTLEKTRLLGDYLAGLPDDDLRRAAIYMTGQPYGRSERRTLNLGGAIIGRALQQVAQPSGAPVWDLYLRHSDVGDWAREALTGHTRGEDLPLGDVATRLEDIRQAPTIAEKERLLAGLLGTLDPEGARYLLKIITFELRIGLQEGLVEAALAQAFDVPLASVRRVHMLTGDIGETALRCRRGQLENARLTLFVPLRFMLASPVETPAEAFQRMGMEASAGDPLARPVGLWTEEKYDGVRCQLHVAADGGADGRCELFSRDLKETTTAFPELVEAARELRRELVLDGEVLAHRDGHVLPFFELQRRLGRKQVSERMRRDVPIVLVVFDVLSLDGEAVMDLPLLQRRRLLEGLGLRPPFLLARVEEAFSVEELERIFHETRDRGNEGLMVKDPVSPYSPGRRGMSWLKVKRPLATLDVIVTAVEWGHGKRRGVLSDYTFAVRDDESGRLLNVGKAYTGLTDAEIAEMTRWFLDHTIADHGRVRVVEPTIVAEVAFDSIQRSPRHRSGYALRFPRIVRLRSDKPLDEIDTVSRVEELYRRYFDRFVPLARVAEAPEGDR